MPVMIIREPATPAQLEAMRVELGDLIKLAVDLKRGIVAGGGELHSDCEEALLRDGSAQRDIWGGDWHPDTDEVRFESLINIRPRQDNPSLELQSPALREQFEATVRRLLEVHNGP